MPLDLPGPTVGWRPNRLNNTSIPPPAPQKQVGPPLLKSKWPAIFKNIENGSEWHPTTSGPKEGERCE